ncbi:carbohydrate ABC transporter permease [Glycomyces artemisiae]|uniref:Multiple sugar transport system permease protein/putative aldouronate transport system permease protein n=1 Tax=Glycomyces artemisiae TaxID=1076443 RepID=A0A2T0USU2_9ACTN|nr:carbohydrate ABC transporter permease [Glycomyces artemisiae]PRY60974.1 multiple sugar transport system permease protein/putative aldouronate transport system permease protein [Glycomyces artemisiae]
MTAATLSRQGKNSLPPWMSPPSVWVRAVKALVIVLIVITMIYPLVYVIAMSFASPSQARAGVVFPTEFSLDAYRAIFNGGTVTQGLTNSLFITVVGTILSLAATSMLAWGLARTRQVPGAKAVLILVLATMFFSAGIIPNFMLVKYLGLLDSTWSLIIPGLISAFNMIVIRNFFQGLPEELIEAARIDGAGEWRIFLRIVLPLSKPVLAVMGLFYAVGYWNTYFNALLYINDSEKWPIQVVLQQYVLAGVQIPGAVVSPDAPPPPGVTLQMAVIVLATVPILVVYPFLQRYFTSGVLTGAIKG